MNILSYNEKLTPSQQRVLKEILDLLESNRENILLLGMPGSGRTTIIRFILKKYKKSGKIYIKPERFQEDIKLLYKIIRETLEEDFNLDLKNIPNDIDFLYKIENLSKEVIKLTGTTPIIIIDDFGEIIKLKQSWFLTDFSHLINTKTYKFILSLSSEEEELMYRLQPKLERRLEMWDRVIIPPMDKEDRKYLLSKLPINISQQFKEDIIENNEICTPSQLQKFINDNMRS
ncbi:MAG: ATP-binding protein [Candidatus Helarchaeota archaeon]